MFLKNNGGRYSRPLDCLVGSEFKSYLQNFASVTFS